MRGPRDVLDVQTARHCQQLFLANMFGDRLSQRRKVLVTELPPTPKAPGYQQLLLFNVPRDLSRGRASIPPPPDPLLAAHLDQLTREYAKANGWSRKQLQRTRYGIDVLLGLQDFPGTAINATDLQQLRTLDLTMWGVEEVLAKADMLVDDRTCTFDGWYTDHIAGLPAAMTEEVQLWYQVMRFGRNTSPRRKPRSETTIRLHAYWMLPALQDWAALGYTSLRQVTREDVHNVLPGAGNPRSTMGQGLKSLFRVLKLLKVVFINPTARVKTGEHASRQPVPANLDAIRRGLNSRNVAQAAIVGLFAFHGLRVDHLRRMHISDLSDGYLRVGARMILLAQPALQRLNRWLDYRDMRFPDTHNPHVFIHYRTAGKPAEMVGGRWIWYTVGDGINPRQLREDRILAEAHATGGDMRALIDLFGLSPNASTRYLKTLDHPDLLAIPDPR